MLHGIAWPWEAKPLSFAESCHGAGGSLAGDTHWTVCHASPEREQKTTMEKLNESLMHFSLHVCVFFFFFLKKQNKSSSPQVKHNLTSKFSDMRGRRREAQHAFTASLDLVYCVI